MQYELQKLERMSLEAVREIAETMGLHPRRNQTVREISYAILDAQADNRAAVVQAKEEAREAAGKPAKRERARGVNRSGKINTTNLKSERVLATVGTEKEQLDEMQEQLKANNHKPNRTVQSVESRLPLNGIHQVAAEADQAAAAQAEAPKKRGRKKKSETAQPAEEANIAMPQNEAPQAAEAPQAEAPKKRGRKKKTAEPVAEAAQEAQPAATVTVNRPDASLEVPSLGENVIALGTLECAPDGYGFLRSADYNYLSSPDDVYVSKEQVRQYGLKPGDTVECSIRVNPQPEKFFPMDKVIRINGLAPEKAKQRVAFENLIPLFPDQKFKLCTGYNDPLSVRIIDLFAPEDR